MSAVAIAGKGCDTTQGPGLSAVVALLKGRVRTIEELAESAVFFYRRVGPSAELRQKHYTEASLAAAALLERRFAELPSWNRESINKTLKSVVDETRLKMPMIAMPLRVMVAGKPDTPSIDATLELIDRDEVRRRIREEVARSNRPETGASAA